MCVQITYISFLFFVMETKSDKTVYLYADAEWIEIISK